MRGIDEIDDANGWTGGVLCLMARCVTFLDEFNELDVAGLRKVALEAEEPAVLDSVHAGRPTLRDFAHLISPAVVRAALSFQ